MQYSLTLASLLATTALALALPNPSPYEFVHWEHEEKREATPSSSLIDITHFTLTTTPGSLSQTFQPPSTRTIFPMRISNITELDISASSHNGKIPYLITELRVDVKSNEHIQYRKMTCMAFSDFDAKDRVYGPWVASEGVQVLSGGKAVEIGSVGCDVERGAA